MLGVGKWKGKKKHNLHFASAEKQFCNVKGFVWYTGDGSSFFDVRVINTTTEAVAINVWISIL